MLVHLAAILALALPVIWSGSGIVRVSDSPCEFRLGFRALHDLIPDVVGNCASDETHNPQNGDALQQTTRGLLVWRKADNWTAFTDGSISWLNGPCGLQSRPN